MGTEYTVVSEGAMGPPGPPGLDGVGNISIDPLWDAKGDLVVGTGPDAAITLAVGSANQVLTVDATTATGLKWAAPAGGSGSVAADTIWDAKGDLPVGTGPDTAIRLGVGSANQVLTVDASTASGLKWATPATPTTIATDTLWDTKGDIAVGTGADAAIRLGVGTNGQALIADSTTATGLKWAAVAGSVAADTIWDAKGDLPVGTGPDTAIRLGVGANGQVLTADNTTASGLKWAAPSGGSGSVAIDTLWDTKGDIAVGTGPDAAIKLGVGTNGQALVADSATASGLKWATPATVATDTIWDAKGDLAVGTGADTAIKLVTGSDGQVLVADSTTASGLKWATNTGTGHTVTYGASPHINPTAKDEWIDSADGTVYTYINDGTSSQWVELGYHGG